MFLTATIEWNRTREDTSLGNGLVARREATKKEDYGRCGVSAGINEREGKQAELLRKVRHVE